jgi:phosphoglycerate kinase
METNVLYAWNIFKKRILMRVDFNVPLDESRIIDDFRLEATLPSIDFLIKQEASSICLITHIGNPHTLEPLLSTKRLLTFFNQKGYCIAWADTIRQAHGLQRQQNSPQLILLENLRFTPYEKSLDFLFAQQLSDLGDFFIQDAFASLASSGTSITRLPYCFDENKRTIGLLVSHEMTLLDEFKTISTDKTILILGGIKVPKKIIYLKKLFEITDTILLLPPLAATFMAAQNKEVGKTPIFAEYSDLCLALMDYAKQHNKIMQIPIDFHLRRSDGSFYYNNVVRSTYWII